MRTANVLATEELNLVHAALGLATECGEFTTEVKRAFAYAKPITDEMRAHMSEELGDVLWYIALAAHHLNIPMAQMAEANIAKLQKRFPNKFSSFDAEARADKQGLDARSS